MVRSLGALYMSKHKFPSELLKKMLFVGIRNLARKTYFTGAEFKRNTMHSVFLRPQDLTFKF